MSHFHARYAEFQASISIETGEILAGEFPGKQLKLVQAWAEIHKDELTANWTLAVEGNALFKIDLSK
ncbi:MAG: DUF4160 domain-containing protein [Pyrinomonadaceae bacterium]